MSILPPDDDFSLYTPEQLRGYLKTFPESPQVPIVQHELDKRENARLAAQSQGQHQENQTLGQKTLFWARLAGIAAIVALIAEIPLSKLLPSKPSQALRASSTPTATAAPTAAPTATISPLATPQATLTPEATSTPE